MRNEVRRAGIAAAGLMGLVLQFFPASVYGQDDFRWNGLIEPGDEIEIKNVIGDIRAEISRGNEVEVYAMKDGRQRDFDLVDIRVIEHSRGVTVCAVYLDDSDWRDRDRRRSDRCDAGGNHTDNIDVEVNFEVRIPAGVVFAAQTVVGDVEAFRLESEVGVGTVSGDIEIETTDVAEASSVSGDIEVIMGRNDWRGELTFNSVSGDITIYVSGSLNTDVSFQSVSGDMESDFPISLRARRGFAAGSLRGTIGDGGRDLSLRTVSGDVRLFRRP